MKKKTWLANLMIFLSILGPGIITGSVDNDAGGITTYSQAGAQYGYKILWTMIPCFIVLFVIQEMNARMGIVSGKGLADLIRENFGVKITFFIFLGLIVADMGNTATEFAGVAGSAQVFGISKYVAVPLAAVAVWFLVVKGNYKSTEKLFLVFSVFLLIYIIAALKSKPDWHAIGNAIAKPHIQFDQSYISMIIAIVGTTIAPWMQFYMQSAVIEKGIKIEQYKFEIMDVVVGSLVTVVVAFFIIVSCAASLNIHGVTSINDAKDAALALKPFAGEMASGIFGFGLFIASIFSATILPLATAFYICEAFGFEAGVDKKVKEAPQFYTLFTSIMAIGALIILIPNAPLIQITIITQQINGILLPIVLVCMLIMVNRKEIMGKHVNGKINNLIGFTTAFVLIGLTAVFMLSPIINKIFGS